MGKPQHVVIKYTNHRGETEDRIVRPININFSTSPYHDSDGPEWLMEAFCEERGDQRTFAMKDVSEWREVTADDLARLDELVAAREAMIATASEPPLTDDEEE